MKPAEGGQREEKEWNELRVLPMVSVENEKKLSIPSYKSVHRYVTSLGGGKRGWVKGGKKEEKKRKRKGKKGIEKRQE